MKCGSLVRVNRSTSILFPPKTNSKYEGWHYELIEKGAIVTYIAKGTEYCSAFSWPDTTSLESKMNWVYVLSQSGRVGLAMPHELEHVQ